MFQEKDLLLSLPVSHRTDISDEMSQRVPRGPRPAVNTDNYPVRHQHVCLPGLYSNSWYSLLRGDEDVSCLLRIVRGKQHSAVIPPVPFDDADDTSSGPDVDAALGVTVRHRVQVFFFVDLLVKLDCPARANLDGENVTFHLLCRLSCE